MSATEHQLPSMGLVAKQLRKYSGRGRMVLIGPVRTGRECLFESMIYFGAVAGEPPPPELVAAADVVIEIKRADEITGAEADKLREDLIGLCRCYFKRVHVQDRARAGRRDRRVLPRREEPAAARRHSRRSEFDMSTETTAMIDEKHWIAINGRDLRAHIVPAERTAGHSHPGAVDRISDAGGGAAHAAADATNA